MPEPTEKQLGFLKTITEIINDNISDDQFGVSELAERIGMSRSNLLRRVQKITNKSVSQFIREVRLENSLKLLKEKNLTITEISFEVGFSSPSYYIKCFREYYGYPPGEANNKILSSEDPKPAKRSFISIAAIAMLVLTIMVTSILIIFYKHKNKEQSEKSIAVLPFKNDSSDSTNIYLVNGLMESLLNKLQKIEDIRVISRTSVEKYRHTDKTIKEIAKELNVRYFVEGSGQKAGNKILLNIQLIDGEKDKHLWAEQYSRELKDIFTLQQEIAKSITTEIEVIITPEEKERIEKTPTDNLVAYDYFLQASEHMNKETKEGLLDAIPLLEQAIELDPEFAKAYASLAICYYFLDIFQYNKKHSNKLNYYADKALLLDPDLTYSLIAKAFYYISTGQPKLAVPYLEKALEYNPSSAFVINTLSDLYTSYIPNTGKYLEYALRGINIDVGVNDSTSKSYTYLHLSNALIQTGFINQALKYINLSLDYDHDNIYSHYVRAYILYAKDGNLNKTKDLILQTFRKDTTRLDVMQELGNVYYYLREYDSAHYYFGLMENMKSSLGLKLFDHKYAEMGVTAQKLGYDSIANIYFNKYEEYLKEDDSFYRELGAAMYYSHLGQTENALIQLEKFSKSNDYHYWTVIFVDIDPMMDNIRENVRYKELKDLIEKNFMKNQKDIRQSLEKNNLL